MTGSKKPRGPKKPRKPKGRTVVRCSSLPVVFNCGMAARGLLDLVEVKSTSDIADLGSAVHEVLAARVEGADIDLDAIAASAEVDPQELHQLVETGVWMWETRLKDSFPGVASEVKMGLDLDDTWRLEGTADLLAYSGHVAVGDWKSGRVRSRYMPQLKGYALLGMAAVPEAREADIHMIWLRFKEVDRLTLSQFELVRFRRELLTSLQSERYVTGLHCHECPRKHSCPARREVVGRAISDLVGGDKQASFELAVKDGRLHELRAVAKAAKAAAEDLSNYLRTMLEQGPIESGGYIFDLMPTKKRHLDKGFALPVLRDVLGNRFDEILKPSLTAAEAIVREGAERGLKKTAVEILSKRLDEAGALTTSTEFRITEKEV